jgi:hypothetical protein
MTVNLTSPHHRLVVSVDESGQIAVGHRRLHDELFLSVQELAELVQRAPEIRAEAVAAFNRAVGDGGAA